MKNIVAFLICCLLSFGTSVYSQATYTKVNLILIMDDGKVGKVFFDDLVEYDELEQGETKEDALKRINKELSYKLKEGLHKKSKSLRFGEYEDAQYILTVKFIESNEDGQRASFEFEFKNNSNGDVEKFTEKDKGGTFGSKLNLLGDCLEGVGKKAGKDIENLIQGKKRPTKYVDPVYD